MADRQRTIRITRDSFIHGPYFDCPSCKAKSSLGVTNISGHSYARRCRECSKGSSIGLPKLARKLIYLDQCAVSNMMLAINPNLEPKRKARVSPFWGELFRRVDRLRSLQLIACPQSDIHESESAVAALREELQHMYEHLSAGVRFRRGDWIRSSQLADQVVNWASGKDSNSFNLDRRRVLHGDPSEWTDVFRVSITMRDPVGYVSGLRRARRARADRVASAFDRWKSESKQGKKFIAFFKEQARAEVDDWTEAYRAHAEKYQAMASLMRQLGADTSAFEVPPPPAHMLMVRTLVDGLEHAGVARKDLWSVMLAYAASGVAEQLPFIRLAVSMWATLAIQAKALPGPPGQGLTNDVSMVSMLMPYCDAMFVDKACHGLIRSIPGSHKPTYACGMFSVSNQDAFLEYLQEIEDSASPEHLAEVSEVYGNQADTPSVLFRRDA